MNSKNGLIIILLLIGLCSLGCEQEKEESLFDPDYLSDHSPVITAMSPLDSALAGIVEITISGQNFSPQVENNFVYFDKTKAEVLEASETQLKVQSPNVVEDAMMVKVAVFGAVSFSNLMPYKLVRGVGEYGGFGNFDDIYVVECDKEENLYVALGSRKILKIAPDETVTEYGTTAFPLFSTMKFGPDGYLYIGRLIKAIYRIPPGGGAAKKWISMPDNVYDFDFSDNGMLYVSGKGDSLYLVKPDESVIGVAAYPDTYIKAVRIFNGYVYVGGRDNATDREFIWRNQILGDNSVGENELYFDWSANVDETSEILSMTFSADGEMFVGTDAEAGIINVHSDGTFEPLYPGVLEPETYSMAWGNGFFLYIARRNDDTTKRRVIKINMLTDGAPYYGRP